ncbi:MAG: outer membrane beta-barrel protein [Bacteroidia bacterium]|nr:PorT family protein [Bacteroidia bacterium]MDW8157967.1 outer membrane beta-barrel protein [Bacteroidia bacterium]
MEAPYLRYLRLVPSSKIIFWFLAFSLKQLPLCAQWNNLRYDKRPFNMGFTIGINITDVNLHYGPLDFDRLTLQNLREIRVTSVPGLNLGIINNLKLGNNFDLRFIPSVSLQQKLFAYVFKGYEVDKKLEATYMELPVYIKFKSNYYRHYRVYIMSGIKYSINLMSDKKVKDDPDLLKIEKEDLSWEFAFGIDLYGDRVKLSPEIRYSLGLKNIYVNESYYGDAIKLLMSQGVVICLNFE